MARPVPGSDGVGMTVHNPGSQGTRYQTPKRFVSSILRDWRRAAALYALLLAVGLVFGFGGSRAAVNETLDWESGDASQTTGLEGPASSQAFSVCTSVARQARYAAP